MMRTLRLSRPAQPGDEACPSAPALRLVDPGELATTRHPPATPEEDAATLAAWLEQYLPPATWAAFRARLAAPADPGPAQALYKLTESLLKPCPNGYTVPTYRPYKGGWVNTVEPTKVDAVAWLYARADLPPPACVCPPAGDCPPDAEGCRLYSTECPTHGPQQA